MKIQIEPSDRVALVGKTGSGKTFLAKKLMRGLDRVVVVDPKFTFSDEGFKRSQYKLSSWWKTFRIVVRPNRGEDEKLAAFLWRAFKRGGLTIFVDEMTSVSKFFPHSRDVLLDVIRIGREQGVGVWSALQRPAWVPRYVLSEAEHHFIFKLKDRRDRKLIENVLGEDYRLRELPDYHFVYMGPGLTNPVETMYNPASDTFS